MRMSDRQSFDSQTEEKQYKKYETMNFTIKYRAV